MTFHACGGGMLRTNLCPACRLMWMEEYAKRLPDVEMVHATEMLADLTVEGRIPLKEVNTTVTYHDPCDLARNGGVYDAPRQVLNAIPGLELVEVHERRERGMCCGGGGDLEMVDPGLAQRVSERTVGKFAATGASTIVTACPQCVRTLSRGVEACAPDVGVVDVVEILARALIVIEMEDSARDLASLIHGVAVQPWLEQSVADWRKRGLLKV